jgi:hypothetical protein
MKRILAVLLLGLFLINIVSALDIDNVQSYDKNSKTYLIENALGFGDTLAEIKLNTPLNFNVPVGYQKVAEFQMNNYKKDYKNAFKDMKFYKANDLSNEISRTFDYKYLTYETVKEPYFEDVCEFKKANGTHQEVCNVEEVGKEDVIKEKWISFSDIEELPKNQDTVTIGIFTVVQKNDYIEWIPTLFGERLTEWATWTASLNVDILAAYKLNATSGNVLDATGNFTSSTYSIASRGVPGIISNASYFALTDYVDFDSLSTTSDIFSISLWINSTDACAGTLHIIDSDAESFRTTFRCNGGNYEFVHGGTTNNIIADTSVNNGTWNHFVIAVDGTNQEIYLNGKSILNDTSSSADNIKTSNTIGAHHSAHSNGALSRLDEIVIWDREITKSEVLDLYNGGSGITYTDVFGPADNPPTVNLNSPNSGKTTNETLVDFNATAYDDINLINVSLYLDGSLNQTNSSGINNTDYIFTHNLSVGNHQWIIQACDNSSQCTNSSQRSINIVSGALENTTISNNFTNGLMGYFDLENTSVIDRVGNFSSSNEGATFVSGKIFNAASFDGSTDWINITTGIVSSSTVWSQSMWVKSDSNDALMFLSDYEGGSGRISLRKNGDDLQWVQSGGGTTVDITTWDNINDSAWHHLAFVANGTSFMGYLDGQSIKNDTITARAVSFNISSNIGAIRDATPPPTTFFDGQIDELGLWEIALNPDDISAIYNFGEGIGWDYSPPVPESIIINNPDPYVILQRHNSTTGEIYISGIYTGSPTTIEASFNGGSYKVIDSSPSGNTFSGYINETVGNGTITARFSNAIGVSDSVDNIGVGDVYVIAGQSNAEGIGQNLNTFDPSLGFSTVFMENGTIRMMNDPTDSSVWAGGSPWVSVAEQLLENDSSVPVMFLSTADAGSRISAWKDGAYNYTNSIYMVSQITYGSNKTKAVLFFQGESDIFDGTSYNSYYTDINSMVNAYTRDISTDTVIIGQVNNDPVGTLINTDNIRRAQRDTWINNSNASKGPITYDITTSSGAHFYTNTEIQKFADRWYTSIQREVLSSGIDSPEVVNITYDGIANNVTLIFNKQIENISTFSGTSGTVPEALEFHYLGSYYDSTDVSASTITGNQIELDMTPTINSSYDVSFARGVKGRGKKVPRDSLESPVLPFYNNSMVFDAPPIVTLNSPMAYANLTSSPVTFNCTVSDNNDLTEVSFYINSILNQTNSSGINNTDYIFTSNLADGTYNWSCSGKDNLNQTTIAPYRIFYLDANSPVINVTSPTGTYGFLNSGNPLDLNWTVIEANPDSCWFDYNNNITLVNCSSNYTTFNYFSGVNNLTFYANDTIGNEANQTTAWTVLISIANSTYNEAIRVSEQNNFQIYILTSDASILNPSLVYQNQSFSATLTTTDNGFYLDSNILTTDSYVGDLNEFYWNITLDSVETITNTFYQNVSDINFSICDGANNVEFLRMDFQDELNLTSLNASIRTSSFEYYLEEQAASKTYIYSSVSENNEYEFCFDPSIDNISTISSISYSSGDYPERTFGATTILSNITLNQTLNLLSDTSGIYATFEFLDSTTKTPLSDVDVTIYDGSTLIIAKTTDDSGQISEWLNPNVLYDITSTKTGYITDNRGIRPITISTYTIELVSDSAAADPSIVNGLVTIFYPEGHYLDMNTTYGFGFYAKEGEEEIDTMKITLYDEDSTQIFSTSKSGDGNITQESVYTGLNKSFKVLYELTGEEGGSWKYYKTYYIAVITQGEYSLDSWGKSFNTYFPAEERTTLTRLIWYITWFLCMLGGFTFGYNGSFKTAEDYRNNVAIESRSDLTTGLFFAYIITWIFCFFNFIPVALNYPTAWWGSEGVEWIEQYFFAVIMLLPLVPAAKASVGRWFGRGN